MFAEFADKIIHVVVDDTPPGYTHDRDTFQKNAVGRGLKDCTDDDIIIFSDLDEIPNPEKVKEIIENFERTKIYQFAQRFFYCFFFLMFCDIWLVFVFLSLCLLICCSMVW